MEKCAYLYENGKWVGFKNPTPAEMKTLRSKGAVVLRKQVQQNGNKLYTTWITDDGVSVIEKVEHL